VGHKPTAGVGRIALSEEIRKAGTLPSPNEAASVRKNLLRFVPPFGGIFSRSPPFDFAFGEMLPLVVFV